MMSNKIKEARECLARANAAVARALDDLAIAAEIGPEEARDARAELEAAARRQARAEAELRAVGGAL